MNRMLEHKCALVSGATSGIGRATALKFVSEGARVAAIGRDEAELGRLATESGGAVVPIRAELTDDGGRRDAVAAALAALGSLDVLVNAAGVLENGTALDTPLASFDRVMDVNVRSLVALTQLALPHLVARRGNVVNVSSVAGSRAFPNVMGYCVSKAAVDQFTRCAALELAEKGVRVNAVNPGVVVTAIHRRSGMDEAAYAAFLERSAKTHPLGRVGRPDEVADLIAFLASDRAGWMTGACVAIDGGRAETCMR